MQRQRLWTCARVLLLTYVAVFAQSTGYLTRLEHVLYDQRVAHCQRYMPPPTQALVHLDIDDTAVAQIGRWPWHRDVMAEILEEIRLTGPKVLAMDILFAEPEELAYDRTGKAIDRDAKLTETIRKFGRVLVPASFTFEQPTLPSHMNRRLIELLTAEPDLTTEQCEARLRASGLDGPNMAERVNQAVLVVRPEALYERIHRELGACQSYSLAPVLRGEGWGEGPSDKLHNSPERPLTLTPLTLSPEYRGEGTSRVGSALADALVENRNGPETRPPTRTLRQITRPPEDIPALTVAYRTSSDAPNSLSQNVTPFDPLPDNNSPDPKANLKRKLFPHADPQFTGSVLDRLFDEEYDRVVRERALERFTLPLPTVMVPVIEGHDEITPLLQLSDAAAYSAFVNYLPDAAEGAVRRVPLVASYRGRIVPHMGLATACAMLDVDIHDLRFSADSITLPRKNAPDIVIPTDMMEHTGVGSVGFLMEVPMFGKRGSWQTMYDFPAHQKPVQHVSVYEVWRICQTRHRMASNERAATQLLQVARENGANVPPDGALFPLQGDAKRKLIADTVVDLVAATASPDLPAEIKAQMVGVRQPIITQLNEVLKQADLLQDQLTRLRTELQEKLHGKAIFLGGTATGHVDQFPTSLHSQCPGVVIHGAIVNAILTGKMWRVAPPWVTVLLTALGALLAGTLTTLLSPAKSFVTAVLLCGGYLGVNGYVLFDYCGLIVGAAGPAFAIGLAWTAITLFDFMTEASERARITRRFSSYVDPSLVNFVIKHPEQARFSGEAREMTMGFTDLADFTTLTESLGPRTVPLLAEYMNNMIPAIRAHQGYVSRLMGDGIYFFFGAPEPDTNHAVHAVNTILDMHAAVARLNLTFPQRNFPELHMRAGLCTGNVIVGDAGSNEFHDYTAVGDSVNTAARLESANKFLGTKSLISARTIELLNGQFLFRPIANLRVKGKVKGVMVYEPLCRKSEETAEHQHLADLSVQIVSTFQCGNFEGCVEAADRLEHELGTSKFSALYRMLSLQYQEAMPDDFDGQVILTEK